jgi:hypothetical protein
MQDEIGMLVPCLEIGGRLGRAGRLARIGMHHAVLHFEHGAGGPAIDGFRGISNIEIVEILAIEQWRPLGRGRKPLRRRQQDHEADTGNASHHASTP